jgi:peptidoglycan/LPS O-acetylase OafA/YrhL
MKDRYTNKKINYSFELLRLILSLWVVIHHCYQFSYIYRKGLFPVATFMIMSFYFYYNILIKKDIIKIKQRFQRILIPYIGWPILLFIFNNYIFKLLGFSLYNKQLYLNDFIVQLTFGQKYHPIFYYQFNLIFLTVLFTIISFLFNKSFFWIFQILLIVAYILQYSFLNVDILEEYSNIVKFSLGHIFEILPFAVMGITLRHLDITTKLKKFKALTITYIGIIFYLILKFEIFAEIRGYFYPGVIYNIGGNCIFILFCLLSFQNKILISILKIITKFTGGIYYIHMVCYVLLMRKIQFIKDTVFDVVIIF